MRYAAQICDQSHGPVSAEAQKGAARGGAARSARGRRQGERRAARGARQHLRVGDAASHEDYKRRPAPHARRDGRGSGARCVPPPRRESRRRARARGAPLGERLGQRALAVGAAARAARVVGRRGRERGVHVGEFGRVELPLQCLGLGTGSKGVG